jgi:hypothetical protein
MLPFDENAIEFLQSNFYMHKDQCGPRWEWLFVQWDVKEKEIQLSVVCDTDNWTGFLWFPCGVREDLARYQNYTHPNSRLVRSVTKETCEAIINFHHKTAVFLKTKTHSQFKNHNLSFSFRSWNERTKTLFKLTHTNQPPIVSIKVVFWPTIPTMMKSAFFWIKFWK